MTLTRDDFATWLDRYIAAWRSGEPDEIGDLFKPSGANLLLINAHVGSDSEGYEVRVRATRYRSLVVWYEMLWF